MIEIVEHEGGDKPRALANREPDEGERDGYAEARLNGAPRKLIVLLDALRAHPRPRFPVSKSTSKAAIRTSGAVMPLPIVS